MPAERSPNILFLFPDQWRPDWLGCVGRFPARTPNLDRLATLGVRFTRAYCTSPLCAPSRASLAAGLRPHRTGVRTNHDDYPVERPTFYRLLRDAGYRVAVAGKSDLHKATFDNGPDGWTPRLGRLGFTDAVETAGKWDAVNHCRPRPFEPYTRSLEQAGLLDDLCADYVKRRAARPKVAAWASALPPEHHIDEFVGQAALRLLEGFPREAPWFLQVGFPSPHEPLDPPADALARWQDVEFPPPLEPDMVMEPADHQAVRRAYAALVEHVDAWCGRLVDTVVRRGELDRTLIVFASDHGEMLGDHGRWGKTCYYESSLGVPLIVTGPNVAGPGRTCGALAELADLAPTFLEWAGLEVPRTMEARSLGALLRDESDEHREVAISVLPGHRAILTERYKLIVRDGQIPVLFDLEDDPNELANVTDRHPQILAQLAERLGEEEGRQPA